MQVKDQDRFTKIRGISRPIVSPQIFTLHNIRMIDVEYRYCDLLAIIIMSAINRKKTCVGRGTMNCKWAHLDSNQGPISYEPTALTTELWALAEHIVS